MKTTIQRIVLATLMASMGVGCSTVYDRYGNPRTVVEPGAAVLGAAAAGLVGYGIARNRSDRHHRHHRHHDYDDYRYARYGGPRYAYYH